MKKTMFVMLIAIAAASGCATDDLADLETESVAQAATVTGRFTVNLNSLELPPLVSKRSVCERLDGFQSSVTVMGCTTTTTLSDCRYDATSGDCNCTATQSRGAGC